MLLHYFGKLKIQIFCRYSAHLEENANKLHLKYTDCNSSTRVTVYSECNYVFLSKSYLNIAKYHVDCWQTTMLIVDKHCCDWLTFDKVTESVKVGTFLRHRVVQFVRYYYTKIYWLVTTSEMKFVKFCKESCSHKVTIKASCWAAFRMRVCYMCSLLLNCFTALNCFTNFIVLFSIASVPLGTDAILNNTTKFVKHSRR